MGNFGSFVKKETLHILRDRRTMLVVLLIPVVLMTLFGFAISTEINNIDVAVVAPHRTESVRQAVERMASNPYCTFKGYIPSDEIDGVLRRGEASAVAVFAADYDRIVAMPAPAEPAVQLIFDASNTNTAMSGAAYLQSILTGASAQASPVEMRLLYNPQMRSAYNFVPGIMGMIFILICALMTSVSIVREKENGTMEVLLVSPVRPMRIVLAKLVPYFMLSCINLATILLLAAYALDVPLSGSAGAIIAVSLLYLVLALALGLLISTLAEKQIVALIISAMLLMMPIVMLSGMLFPVENMPAVLQAISYIVPARWYIEAIRKLMIEGLPFAAVWREVLILLAMTIVFIVVSVKKFNDKLE